MAVAYVLYEEFSFSVKKTNTKSFSLCKSVVEEKLAIFVNMDKKLFKGKLKLLVLCT